jgi:hypothetical protein
VRARPRFFAISAQARALLVHFPGRSRVMNAAQRGWFKRIARLATLLATFVVVWACNAPFIPVPPPGANFTTMLVTDSNGAQKTVWITNGLPASQAAFAHFFVYNERLGSGIIATANADGTFTGMPMDGDMGDRILINYQALGGDYSDSVCLLLTEDTVAPGGSAPSCPPR